MERKVLDAECGLSFGARAPCRSLLGRGFANLFRCEAHFFSDIGDPLAKFFEQSFNAGELFIDGGEYTDG